MRSLVSASSLAVQVESSGTGDWHVGKAPDHRMQSVCLNKGIDISLLRAQQFNSSDFERFDLIVAMDESNRADVERLRPSGCVTRVVKLLDYSSEFSGDVYDPYYGDTKGFELSFSQIYSGCAALLEALDHGA